MLFRVVGGLKPVQADIVQEAMYTLAQVTSLLKGQNRQTTVHAHILSNSQLSHQLT